MGAGHQTWKGSSFFKNVFLVNVPALGHSDLVWCLVWLKLESCLFCFFNRRAIEIVESDVKSQTVLKPLSGGE